MVKIDIDRTHRIEVISDGEFSDINFINNKGSVVAITLFNDDAEDLIEDLSAKIMEKSYVDLLDELSDVENELYKLKKENSSKQDRIESLEEKLWERL